MVSDYGKTAVGDGGDSDELESGFEFGSFFVPFSEVMRV